MKLVANIQLLPTNAQAVALCDLMEHCHAAGAWLSERAWATKMFQQCLEAPQARRTAAAQPAEDSRRADSTHEEHL
jgi:hypothetical protein